MKKKGKKMLIALGVLIGLVILGIWGYMQHPIFGKAPSGERLERIKKSPNYRDGQFHNLSETPSLAEGYTMLGVFWDFLFTKYPNVVPVDSIPSVQPDWRNLDPNEDLLIWFGHSSYYIQLGGKKYLIDPVFSGNASPLAGTNRAFPGSEIVKSADLPEIDFMLITHDHYDHLDHITVKELMPKVKKVITGLGVGEHLEYWGYDPQIITELDWNESLNLEDSIQIYAVPGRHFSGRTFKRNNTLWVSFVLETSETKIFIGGDSGYDPHFKKIGEEFGPFDLAILENGQYDDKWRYIHFLPEEVAKVAQELKAKRLLPVHNSKFKLGNHPWNEPLERITKEADQLGIPCATPKIGELLHLKDENQTFEKWWEGIN